MSDVVGRDAEIEWLRERLDDPDGGVLVVTGEAGVGKTTVVESALEGAETMGRISFPPARLAVPGYGLRSLAEAAGERGAALAAALEAGAGTGDFGYATSVWRAADGVVSASRGRILLLDDAQWADELTLSWVTTAGPALQAARAAVVLVVRCVGALPQRVLEAITPHLRAHAAEMLQIDPLTPNAVLEMTRAAGIGDALGVAPLLHDRTDGLPLAVAAALREISRTGDSGVLTPLPEHSPPLVLTAVVQEQLAGLRAEASNLVRIVSILPAPTDVETLFEIAGTGDAVRWVDEAVTAGLLAYDGSGVRFRHELQREVVSGLLSPGERRSWHARAAAVLAARGSSPATQVAQLFVGAEDVRNAVTWLRRAAVEASAVHDHGNELSHLVKACELETDPAALAELGEHAFVAAKSAGRWNDGAALMTNLLERVGDDRLRARLLLCRGRLNAYFGDMRARDADLRAAVAAAEASHDASGVARVLGELALPGATLHPQEMIDAGRRGVAIAERLGDPMLIALCANNMATALLFLGDLGAYEGWQRAHAAVPPELMSEGSEEAFRTVANFATGLVAFGDYERAGDAIGRWLRHAVRPSHVDALQAIELELAWRTGRWDDALRLAAEHRGSWSRIDCVAFLDLVPIAIDFERSRHPEVGRLPALRDDLVRLAPEDWGPTAHATLMWVRGLRREPRPARGLLAMAEQLAESGLRVGWDELLPTAAWVAPRTCERALTILGELRCSGRRGEASLEMTNGLLKLHRGEAVAAAAALTDAAAAFASLPDPYSEAKCCEAAATALEAAGRRPGPLRRRAAQVYSDLGAERSLARVLRQGAGSRALSEFRIPRGQTNASHPGLTERERQVAALAARGYTSREIADELTISPATAKKHLEHVKRKLMVKRKTELVRLLADEGQSAHDA